MFGFIAGHNPGTEVLKVMARDAEGKVGKFTAQNMSNTLLAYAKLEHHPGHLMEVMAAEALRKLETFTPQVQIVGNRAHSPSCASSAMPGHQPRHGQTYTES